MINLTIKFKDGNVYSHSFFVNDILGREDTVLTIQRGSDGHEYLDLSILKKIVLYVPLESIEYYYSTLSNPQGQATESVLNESSKD